MLGIPKTRKHVMKALALTTPSQLSFHFVVYREISKTLSLHENTRSHSNVSTTEDIDQARCLKSCSHTTVYSSVRSFEKEPERTKLHSWCGTAEGCSLMAAAKGRRLCRAGIHAFAQMLKKNFRADGDRIEIEVRLLQTVLKFYEISKSVTSK